LAGHTTTSARKPSLKIPLLHLGDTNLPAKSICEPDRDEFTVFNRIVTIGFVTKTRLRNYTTRSASYP
jgi:hypothetical protein